MKILIDLIHPANYHYFKYFMQDMGKKGNKIIVTARNKDVLQELLRLENIKYINTGKGKFGKGAIGKLLYLLYAEILFFFIFVKYKPNFVLSFGSTSCAHNAFLFRIPHISFDDTEHAKLNRKLYAPFTDTIFTPASFYESIGKNQIKFNSYMELFYLHPNRFKPNINILKKNQIGQNKKIVFLRFVSWEAFHDIGQGGLTTEEKIELVSILSRKTKVFISSEGKLPNVLEQFRIQLPVNKIHDFLSIIDLYIGEGGTMASECAMLGVPSIYINSLPLMGYLEEAKKYGLLFHLKSFNKINDKIFEILNEPKLKYKMLRDKFIKGQIDPTLLLVWFIENYPESKIKLLKDSAIQNQFIKEN